MKTSRHIVILSIITALILAAGFVIQAFAVHKYTSASTPYFPVFPVLVVAVYGILIARMVVGHDPAGNALKDSVETLRIITDAAKDAIVLMDDDGNISFWNPAAEAIFGYGANEALGKELHLLLVPRRFQKDYRNGFIHFQKTGQGAAVNRTLELVARKKNGEEIPVELSLSALQLNGKWHAAGIMRDISERKKSEAHLRMHHEQLACLVEDRTKELERVNERLSREVGDRTRTAEELRTSERFLGTVFDSIHDPFSIIDRECRIVRINEVYARMKNKAAADLINQPCPEKQQRGGNGVCRDCVVDKTFKSTDPCAREKLVALADGSDLWMEIYTYPIFDEGGSVTHVIEYARDITDRKKMETEKNRLIQELNYLSTTDALTDLFNRRALNEILGHEIDRANRYGSDLSLIICDIDWFKQINDTYGHRAGDLAIQAVTASLKTSIRKADIVGRYGGDEFMIVLPETHLAGAKLIAEKIRSAVENIRLELPGGKVIRLSTSIGVAGCCEPGEDIDTIVARADAALYASKDAGRNRVTVEAA